MKNRQLLKNLVDLNIYQVDYSTEASKNDDMVITDGNGILRNVLDNGTSLEEVKLMLQVKNTMFLQSIRAMCLFFTVLMIAGIVAGFFLFS